MLSLATFCRGVVQPSLPEQPASAAAGVRQRAGGRRRIQQRRSYKIHSAAAADVGSFGRAAALGRLAQDTTPEQLQV